MVHQTYDSIRSGVRRNFEGGGWAMLPKVLMEYCVFGKVVYHKLVSAGFASAAGRILASF